MLSRVFFRLGGRLEPLNKTEPAESNQYIFQQLVSDVRVA